MNELREKLEQLPGLVKAQPRLRAGLWAIVAVLIVQLILMVGDTRRGAGPEIQRLYEQHARLEQALEEADWPGRASEARAQAVALENRFWTAESAGLARAEFQTWLERQAARSRFQIFELEIRPLIAIDQMPGWQRMSVSVQGSPDPEAVVQLLGLLKDADRFVVIDGVRFGGRGTPRSRIDLHAPIRIDE